MQPTAIASVYFETPTHLTDFLASPESAAASIRDAMVQRVKAGEGLVAVFGSDPPQALILASRLNSALAGSPEGDKLIPLRFG